MKTTDLITFIENIAPLHGAADWDSSGIQVASQRTTVKHIALCLDPTPASIHTALEQGADFILSHHPLVLRPRMPVLLDEYHTVLSLLFKHDVALYAAHTSLDVNPQGPAGWLGRSLNLRDTRVLEPTGMLHDTPLGFGLVGELPQALSLQELIQVLKKYIPLETATVCGPTPSSIARVAYCTGSGASLLSAAAKSGADIYITGDIKYHTALETGIGILDVGHHGLEEEMMHHMCLLLEQIIPQITVSFVPSVSPLRPLLVHTC